MAHIHLFCDESGKYHKPDYVSFCGYLIEPGEGGRFGYAWKMLQNELRVPPIHMRKIMHPERDPDGWLKVMTAWGDKWAEKRDEMLMRFAKIVESVNIRCIGAVVDSIYFQSMGRSSFRDKTPDPYYLAFQRAVLRALDMIDWCGGSGALSLVLDNDEATAVTCYRLLEGLKKQLPRIKERISGICFVNDDHYPGIQAADMIAYESRNLACANAPSPSELYKVLTAKAGTPELLSASFLDALASV